MATISQKLTFEEFESQFGNKTHEYWFGQAIPKAMPTWIHGLLQQIIGQLLRERGFFAGSEVELRIDLQARPRPDIIATSRIPREKYPTVGPDIVVEILSDDDQESVVQAHCQKYQEWKCGQIYLVDPSDRSVVRWLADARIGCSDLAGIPVERIWDELDRQYRP